MAAGWPTFGQTAWRAKVKAGKRRDMQVLPTADEQDAHDQLTARLKRGEYRQTDRPAKLTCKHRLIVGGRTILVRGGVAGLETAVLLLRFRGLPEWGLTVRDRPVALDADAARP